MKYKLAQLCDVDIEVIDGDRGKNYPHQNELFEMGYCLFLSAKNVTQKGFVFSDIQFITKEKDKLLNNGKLIRGDLIITTRGTVGNVALYSKNIPYKNIRINSGMLIVRCGEGIDNFYLYHILSSKWFYRQILSIQSGSAQPQLPKSHFLKMMIPLPDLETQRKISSSLKSIDDKIELNTAINENLEQQAQAIYAKMFIDNALESWKIGVLSDIAVITMGQSPKGDTFNEIRNGTVFYQGRTDFGFRFPTRRLYTTEPKRMAVRGDALMSVRAPVGDLNTANEECCIGRGLAAIHSKDNHQSFVFYTLFSLKNQLDVFNGEGTVFGSINKEALNSMKIMLPPIDLVDKFESIANPIDKAICNNYEEICRLQAIRDSLLPKLMNGEIDVSNVRI